MKKTALISLILTFALALSGCSERREESDTESVTSEVTGSSDEPQKEKIGHDAALISALRHVSLVESQISSVKSRLERDNKGVYVYNIKFTSDDQLYEFDIDAYSSEVIRYELDGEVKTGSGLGDSTVSEPEQTSISEDSAKDAALNHAKFAESEVNFTKAALETKDGSSVYTVEFTKGSDKYDYIIDAVTGVIIDFSVDKAGEQSSSSAASSSTPESSKPQSSSKPASSSKSASSSKPQSSSKPASSSKPQSSSKPASSSKQQSSSKPASSSKPQTAQNITDAQAKDIAVKHAKLLIENVTFKEVKTKTDNGILVYDIEFTTSDTEYEYTIDASTGDIIGYSSEKIGGTTSDPSVNVRINEWQAKNTAVSHAGHKMSEVTFAEVKLEENKGVFEYEVEFVFGDIKYEYKVNAKSGVITEHSSKKIESSQPADTKITVDQAKEAALKHSGAAADKANFTEAKLDGSKYEIEFTADGFKYDYEINAADGSVIKSEKEAVSAQ